MKRLFQIALFSTGVFIATQVKAQEEHKTVGEHISKDAHAVGHATASAATTVGHKTSELAAKGAAAVTDKRYDNHWGPGGEDVYINKHSRYFYVNKRGHRVYITKSHMRDKPLQ